MTMSAGRRLDLHLQLLDRQVQDRDGRMICKIDDLEFDIDETGRPYVTAILVGPRALGPRLGGRLGRWVAAVAARLATPDQLDVPRIDFAHVTDIGSAITIARSADELTVAPLEGWVDHYIIARIPGSRHEGE
jgi:sporulation protein YlmC with PRC-barrel domain